MVVVSIKTVQFYKSNLVYTALHVIQEVIHLYVHFFCTFFTVALDAEFHR